ncbi:energy-coupling factor ABC transporter ATP-binding protein [Halobacillus litoralis]|uniref:Energy-coupling factor ABC transporter ATP-binding protein n=1 Tax=Halobacillus litoralis TaxID=45668 RepID=A0A845DW34_9BACI|nr:MULTISPECIES: energy-coupling factor ABC transporter ATP-binding protein [Halobacillus]MCA1024325.1 energy-coupling factor ABC transporter ATP-binding protein [Halobacillus litoralis]MYL21881.1 energy-coupling factor ABC transporter ATP-binding protein [Halobacillus litoralis]MYL31847.1 energy-coupling factor ABC transporter ATP-binding protein [Halobacillus halophilus]MYL39681.1 energy-coupling factor ABC transporter ATP-binding protein [Halobacillus litoralis]
MGERQVEFRNVSFRYQEDMPWVLKNVSFTIGPDEWVAVIGHNGSGKSTIAKLMNGLLFPQEGEVLVDGMPVNEETIWDVRKQVGMVFQNPDNQFVGTTVKDDVAFGMENHGMPRALMIERIKESLSAVGMADYEQQEPHRLSGGQKQRVAIASVLAVSPKFIILDEATAMLDPKGRKEIMNTVRHVQEERDLSLITITHDLHEVTQSSRVIVMNKGEVWMQGSPRDVFSKKEHLQEIGLDTPFVSKLADHLKAEGVPLNREPLNHQELLEELWTSRSTM